MSHFGLYRMKTNNEMVEIEIAASHMVFMKDQNAEKVTHIKGRLLDQAVILSYCVPFQKGNFSLRKEFTPRESEFIPLRTVPYGMENHF